MKTQQNLYSLVFILVSQSNSFTHDATLVSFFCEYDAALVDTLLRTNYHKTT
jgi:hypothetical protein